MDLFLVSRSLEVFFFFFFDIELENLWENLALAYRVVALPLLIRQSLEMELYANTNTCLILQLIFSEQIVT